MWRPWGKSTVKITETYSPTRRNAAASSPTFSCSSFKDIQLLCSDDPSSLSAYSSSSPKKASRIFHRVRVANSILRSWPIQSKVESDFPCVKPEPDSSRSEVEPDAVVVRSKLEPDPPISIPSRHKSIVVYFTSLRVVRSTYEDCRTVRSILRGFRVRIDERDLSMDASFAAELHRIFGADKAKMKLPRVFIGSKYIGGADEVRQLNEVGELKKLVQDLPAVEPGDCKACGGHRFVPCNDCYGSHKLYTEKLGFRSCTACNENGLIRCCSCSFPSLELLETL